MRMTPSADTHCMTNQQTPSNEVHISDDLAATASRKPWGGRARVAVAVATVSVVAFGGAAVRATDGDSTATGPTLVAPTSSTAAVVQPSTVVPSTTTPATTPTDTPAATSTTSAHASHESGTNSTSGSSSWCDGWITRINMASTHRMTVHDTTDGTAPTEADCAGARAFYNQVTESTARFADIEVAYAEGYWMNDRSETKVGALHHLFKRGGVSAVLEPNEPEGLMYYVNPTTNAATFIGVVFKERVSESLPQPGGSLTTWHDHHDASLCAEDDTSCGSGAPAMFHVWTFGAAVDPFGMSFPNAAGSAAARGGGKRDLGAVVGAA